MASRSLSGACTRAPSMVALTCAASLSPSILAAIVAPSLPPIDRRLADVHRDRAVLDGAGRPEAGEPHVADQHFAHRQAEIAVDEVGDRQARRRERPRPIGADVGAYRLEIGREIELGGGEGALDRGPRAAEIDRRHALGVVAVEVERCLGERQSRFPCQLSLPSIDAGPRIEPLPSGVPSHATTLRNEGVLTDASPSKSAPASPTALPLKETRNGVEAMAKRTGEPLPAMRSSGLVTEPLNSTVSPRHCSLPLPLAEAVALAQAMSRLTASISSWRLLAGLVVDDGAVDDAQPAEGEIGDRRAAAGVGAGHRPVRPGRRRRRSGGGAVAPARRFRRPSARSGAAAGARRVVTSSATMKGSSPMPLGLAMVSLSTVTARCG